jgi:hypothetical protein
VSESVAVAAVGGGIRGVDRGDLSDAREESDGGAYNQGFLFGDRNNDGGGSLLGSNLGVGLKVASGSNGDIRGEVDGRFHGLVQVLGFGREGEERDAMDSDF